ncbi:hypothetical protein D3C76_1857120 [compost metagenome]
MNINKLTVASISRCVGEEILKYTRQQLTVTLYLQRLGYIQAGSKTIFLKNGI